VNFRALLTFPGIFYGTLTAPVVAGFIYNRSQTYAPTLWRLVVLFILGALFYLPVHKPWALTQEKHFPHSA